jgi:hypothetical protein
MISDATPMGGFDFRGIRHVIDVRMSNQKMSHLQLFALQPFRGALGSIDQDGARGRWKEKGVRIEQPAGIRV